MLKIRLSRMGSRHRPFYRLVVSDSRQVPSGSALEELGYYDPRKNPAQISLDVTRVDHWLRCGAQLSGTAKNLVARARAEFAKAPAAPTAEATPAAEIGATAEAAPA